VDFHRPISGFRRDRARHSGCAVVFTRPQFRACRNRSSTDPVARCDANGTFNVLRAANEGKVGRVVYAASSSRTAIPRCCRSGEHVALSEIP